MMGHHAITRSLTSSQHLIVVTGAITCQIVKILIASIEDIDSSHCTLILVDQDMTMKSHSA